MKSAGAPLESFALKLPERKMSVSEAFITTLVKNHGTTLRRLAFMDCNVNPSSVTEIARGCTHLERLEICIPMKELVRTFPNTIVMNLFSTRQRSQHAYLPRSHCRP